MKAEIDRYLAAVLPPPVMHSSGPIIALTGGSFPAEDAFVAGAVESRRIEFHNGRFHARVAVKALGLNCGSLAVRPDRSPIWPPGVVGSIAHNRDYCIAVAGSNRDVGGLGVDIENDVPLADEMRPLVLTEAEECTVPDDQVLSAFCAKEAFFKSYFPQTGDFLDFHDTVVSFARDAEQFSVELINPRKRALFGQRKFNGRVRSIARQIVAVIAI